MRKKNINKAKNLIGEGRWDEIAEEQFDCYPMGKDERAYFSTDSRMTGCNNNYLIVGGSGSGKTESIAKPMIYNTLNSNLVVVCTKKKIMEYAINDLQQKGYTCQVLNFVNPKESQYGYDPLQACQCAGDIRDLANTIMVATNHNGVAKDAFWDNSAESMIALILEVVSCHTKSKSMDTAMELIDTFRFVGFESEWKIDEADDDLDEIEEKMTVYPLHNLLEMACEENKRWKAAWKSFNDLPNDTGGCVANCTQEPIAKIFNDEIRAVMKRQPQFNFAELLKPKTAVIVYVSPVNKAHNTFISIFYQQLFKTLFEKAEERDNGKLPYPVQIICDDFATGCKVPNFQELISIFREKRIGVTLLIQSESQLDAMYERKNAITIVNNCDTYVYLGGMDLNTCESISKRINIPCNEVLNMPIGKEYIFRRGQEPIITERYSLKGERQTKNMAR